MNRDDIALRLLASGFDLTGAADASARPGSGVLERAEHLERLRALTEGIGPALAPLVGDPATTDVLLNSTDAWVDRGAGLEPVDLGFADDTEVRSLAVRMAAACGKRLDEASPIVDGTLPGGIRLHAILPAPSASGTLISLRVMRRGGLTLTQMERSGCVPSLVGAALRRLIAVRANVLVSGATGSGKTTLLAALLALVPADERIICIEEVPELHPAHPHAVSLVERRPNIQGIGAVPLSELVRAAMRMRPDRLVLGECRGPEVRDVLLALNTGHDGGWATLHANSAADVPARLHALGALAGMSDASVVAQSVAAIDAIVHLERGRTGRRVREVAVLSRDGAELEALVALSVDEGGRVRRGPGFDALERRLGAAESWGPLRPGEGGGGDGA